MALLLTLCAVFSPSCFVIEANAVNYTAYIVDSFPTADALPYGVDTTVISVSCDIYTDVDSIIRFYCSPSTTEFWVVRSSYSSTKYRYMVNVESDKPIYTQLIIPAGEGKLNCTGVKEEPDVEPNVSGYQYSFYYDLDKSKSYTYYANKPYHTYQTYGSGYTILNNKIEYYPTAETVQNKELYEKVEGGFVSVNDNLNEGFSNVNDSLQQNGEKLDNLNDSLQQNGEKIDEGFSSVNDNLNEGFSNVNDSLQQNGEKLDNLNSTLEETPNKLLEGIKGLFIPTEEDMIEIKDKWQLLMEERFGALYQAGTILVEFSENIKYQGTKTTIELPWVGVPLADGYFEFGGYEVQIVPDGFEDLQNFVVTAVGIVCSLAFVVMLRNKFNKLVGDDS